MNRTTAQMALEALRYAIGNLAGIEAETDFPSHAIQKYGCEAIAALEADLAQPVEPAGQVILFKGHGIAIDWFDVCPLVGTMLYTATPEPAGWQPIAMAPKDSTPVDLWADGERHANMYRVDLGKGNVFYDPVDCGTCCVRNASHWMFPPAAPKATP